MTINFRNLIAVFCITFALLVSTSSSVAAQEAATTVSIANVTEEQKAAIVAEQAKKVEAAKEDAGKNGILDKYFGAGIMAFGLKDSGRVKAPAL